ncbi:MAG: homoaconitate hydratase [Methanobacteriota archaeon]
MKRSALSPFNNRALSESGWRRGTRVQVYDTTLRDGEQMPGVSFDVPKKVRIAEALADAGVPEIEAGFPVVSQRERQCVKAVAGLGTGARILALCRMQREDVDACVDSDIDLMLMFVASSNLHIKHKYRLSKKTVLERSVEAMEYAKSRGAKFSFSTEDSTRSEMRYLHSLYSAAIKKGAERIGFTDTAGCATPEGVAHLAKELSSRYDAPLSAHLHDDLGLALANSLAAMKGGARCFATTVNGIGERAGNLALEEFAVASELVLGARHGIDLEKLTGLSEMVSSLSGVRVPLNKPIVGGNAFTHESGIHVAAILREPFTYEAISPELVGGKRSLTMGKHSGHEHIRRLLASRGVAAEGKALDGIVDEVKRLGELRGRVSEEDFWKMVERAKDGGCH